MWVEVLSACPRPPELVEDLAISGGAVLMIAALATRRSGKPQQANRSGSEARSFRSMGRP
jgi:hypothetical protein